MNHRIPEERVFLSLGSNMGDREKNIGKALDMLAVFLADMSASRIHETEPLLYARQPRFLNCVASGRFAGTPGKLLARTRDIERALGRRRGRQYGPRTIDVDILLFGDREIGLPDLKIPHPEMEKRRFVLVPLLELEPGLRHPLTGECFWKYLDKNPGQGVYFHSFSSYTRLNLMRALHWK